MYFLIIFFALVFLLFIHMYLETKRPYLKNVTIKLRNLPDSCSEIKLLHITDLHGAQFGTDQQKLIKLLDGTDIDFIVITGDLYDSTWRNIKPGINLIEALQKRYKDRPIIFVKGNQEYKGMMYDELEKKLRLHNVIILENKWVKYKLKNIEIYFAGIDDPIEGNPSIKKAVSGIPVSKPMVLLSHSPHVIKEAAEYNVPLMLAGHTHAGQIRLPWIGAITASTPQYLFPKYVSGYYKEGNTQMYISAGLGTREIPLRLMNPPELTVIHLVPEEKSEI